MYQQKNSLLTVLPPDRSDGLVVELGGVGLAVVGNDEDDALVVTAGGGRIRGASLRIDLDQPERRLPPGHDGQLDAQVALVGPGGIREGGERGGVGVGILKGRRILSLAFARNFVASNDNSSISTRLDDQKATPNIQRVSVRPCSPSDEHLLVVDGQLPGMGGVLAVAADDDEVGHRRGLLVLGHHGGVQSCSKVTFVLQSCTCLATATAGSGSIPQ